MNCQSGYLFGAVGFGVGFHIVCLSKVERVAIEVAFATVDQPDVRGSKPHNRDPSGAASHDERQSGGRDERLSPYSEADVCLAMQN